MSALVKDLDNNRLSQELTLCLPHPHGPLSFVSVDQRVALENLRAEAAIEGYQCRLCNFPDYECICPIVTDGTAS